MLNKIDNKKKLKRFFNLFVLSSNATFEDPSIGPNLSPYMSRDRIKLFCEELNLKTKVIVAELKILVKLYLYCDKSFFFIVKSLSFSLLLKLLLNLQYSKFNKNLITITIFEAYDLIYFKNILNSKFLFFDDISLKYQLINNIYSIKNLKLIKK